MAVTCNRLCMETCLAHPMRPDHLRSRDLRLSSQPTEDQRCRDPRPATRSPESHDPKEAGDQGANRQRQVTTEPEFRRGPRGKSPEGWKSRGKGRKAFSDRRRRCWDSCCKYSKTLTCCTRETHFLANSFRDQRESSLEALRDLSTLCESRASQWLRPEQAMTMEIPSGT